ncbi:E3 ubiquitin-protein ligase UBR3 [Gastrophryne carolinensis]
MAAAEEPLLSRDKEATAARLKDEVSRGSRQEVYELLERVLSTERRCPAGEALDWCRSLLAGGEKFEDFCQAVRSYDNAALCGLVWTANFVAYRCRTCGISPCMSLCADCFHHGEHAGHDFNMFRSQAGGACDCGDANVMRESGFCKRHRVKSSSCVPTVPQDLLAMSELVIPRFIFYLIQYLRDGYSEQGRFDFFLDSSSEKDLQKTLQPLEPQISFLEDLTKMGGAMRSVLTQVLTNQQYYKELCSGSTESAHAKSHEKYLAALKGSGLAFPEEKPSSGASEQSPGTSALSEAAGVKGAAAASDSSDEEDQECRQSVGKRKRVKLSCSAKDQSIMDVLKHKCFLEELLFWTVKYEFPQKMVTFLLNMLPDQDYKIAFTKTFVQHYAFIMKTLKKSHESDTMSNRIVHISVQLFSNEELARQVTEECQLLDIMVTVLLYMMESCLIKSELQDEENSLHVVVNCGEALLKNNTYWPLVSDFINILSHQSVAKKFLEDHGLLVTWMNFVSFFQGMNLNKRELNEHVEFESQTYYAAFAAELEACAQPMWGLLSHCKVRETQEYTRNVVRYCLEALQDWFDAINFVDEPAPNQVTFHLPLHRYYAMFLSKAVKCQEIDLDSLLPDQEMLMKLMVHPLLIQASLSEIHSNMWVRNGLQIKGQAMTYVQSHFCNSMIDPDIYLLQVCASRLDPDYFISSIFERFKVVDLLTMASQHQNTVLDGDHERSMLEGALTFLVILLSLRLHLGMTDDEILRAEMIAQLCMNDRTHSSLLDLSLNVLYIPESPNPKSGVMPSSCSFESVLSAVADFKAPVFEPGGSMQQGMYTPKAEIWDQEFDPVMVILRTVYRRDVQSAMDRYTAFLKQSAQCPGNPWPPYKRRTPLHPSYKGLMRLLHCKTLHIVLFTLLYKLLMDHQNMSEHVLCMVLYLIELGLENALEEPADEDSAGPDRCHDSWFPGSNLLYNMRHVINYVRVRVPDTAPEVRKEPPAGTSSDGHTSSTNTGTAQVFSLVAERRKKFQEIINRSNSEANQVVRPKSLKWTAPGSTPQLTTVILEVKESMLSLLIKLHQKLSGRTDSYYPPWAADPDNHAQADLSKYEHGDGVTAVERILLKASSQSRFNKLSIDEICRKAPPPVPPKKSSPAEKKTLDKEERRQKARERQQKLLAEFASRQKSFMETAMDVESPDTDVAMEIAASEPQVAELSYDCVICGQSGPSTEDRPIGLVVLLQATSVLGHRRKVTEPKKLPTSEEEQIYQEGTCAAVHDIRLTVLQRHFKDSSCLQSVSIGWEGGVYVQTCGHTLHLDCHKSYMESLRNDQVLQGFSVEKGEFTCPLCRQFANSVLPCFPGHHVERSHWQGHSYGNKSMRELIKEVEELQEQLGTFPSETNLSKGMEAVMKDIKGATQKKYTDYSKTPGSPDNDFLFMYSVARTNLELELVHRGDNLCLGGASSAGKRSCLNQLFHVLAMHMRLYSIDSEFNPWRKLTQIMPMKDAWTSEEERMEVPLLYRDVTSMLLIQVLTMPQPLHKEHFTCTVKVLYSLLYTQALVALSFELQPEERTTWRDDGMHQKSSYSPGKSWEALLSFVINELSRGKVFDNEETEDMVTVSPNVWSSQSIEQYLRRFCLPFLRITSLLQHHVFGSDIPSCQEDEEFTALCSCLGILQSARQTSCEFLSASCLDWPASAFDLMAQWCSELNQFTENNNSDQAKALLIQDTTWDLPRLLQMPEIYNTIFQYYHRKACSVCNKVPKDPALCLVCGTFVCLKGLCCKQQNYCECVLHSQNCGAGTGIFLLINASVIIIIRGHRFCLWGSVYLDAHGEEDRELRRGKPLYICKERYNVLEQQWVTHTFDHISKRWGPHYNGL